MTDPLRAVVLVGNPAAPYSRAIRVARTLATLGYAVEIAAVAAPGIPDREFGDGYEIRRYRPSGPWARLAAISPPGAGARSGMGPARGAGLARRGLRLGRRALRKAVGLVVALRRWLFWPHTVRGWWATLDRELEPADLYHACGSLTIAAALAARRRSGRDGGARRPIVIYDAVDDVFEGNNVLDMPGPIRAWHRRRETAWARAADLRLSVNDALADRLATRWGRATIAIPNYAQTESLGDPGAPGAWDLIRQHLSLELAARVVLYQGRIGPRLGLDEAAEAVLQVPGAVLVLMGFGRGFERETQRDRDPRFAGRHFTIPPQHPDQLLAWTASADVALIAAPPVSVNQRLSSPNKLWEAAAAGTPLVVPADLTYMASLVRDHGLGVVARSDAPADLAAAIAIVLDVDPAAAYERRVRIVAMARERFTWSVAAAAYVVAILELRETPD